MANRGLRPLAIDLPPEEVPNERTKKKKDTPPHPTDVKLTLKIKFLFDCVEVGGVVVLAPTKAACMYDEDETRAFVQTLPLPTFVYNTNPSWFSA